MMAARARLHVISRDSSRRIQTNIFQMGTAMSHANRNNICLQTAKKASNIRNFHAYETISTFKKSNLTQHTFSKQMQRYYSPLPSHEIVRLPNLSPTMETGTIVSWEKQEGDRIEEGEVLALVETDKSTMEMETPQAGYLAKILMPGGSKDVPVNKMIAIIVSEKEDIGSFKDYSEEESSTVPAKKSPTIPTTPSPPLQGESSMAIESTMVTSPLPVTAAAKTPTASSTARVFASPLAKRTALEKGIDINLVKGSGPRGRITVEDVENFKADTGPVLQPAATRSPDVSKPSAPKPSGAQYTDTELSNMRKTIAKRLTESKQTIPHYYLSIDVNMDSVVELRKVFNAESNDQVKLSVNDFIVKAAALSLLKVPECNSQYMNDFIRQFHNVDISVAVSTEGGLITPIVFNADKKGLTNINKDIKELAEKARNKTIQPYEFVGGTFTISNLGMYGITNFSAVINPPQSCILAVGATEDRILPDITSQTGYKTSKVMSVTLSCDHRVVDGAVGAQWLKTFRSFLEKPITMLL